MNEVFHYFVSDTILQRTISVAFIATFLGDQALVENGPQQILVMEGSRE